MNKITTVGLDIAKTNFHVVGCNKQGKIIAKRGLSRSKLLAYFAKLPTCLVGIEACGSAHYWSRQIHSLGHEVRLIPAQHVQAFLRGNKNDFNDALAIAEAVVRPEMRFVSTRNEEQQDQQTLCMYRSQLIGQRTAQANRLRAMLYERGITMAKGLPSLRRYLAAATDADASELSVLLQTLLRQGHELLQQLDQHIADCDDQLQQLVRVSEDCRRLQQIPGFGLVNTSLFYAYVGNGSDYRRGRDVAASLGLVPRQHSSGGKEVLLGISKRGNKSLRCLLVHGARAAVSRVGDKQDVISRWIRRLIARVGIHKAAVAYANKMARMGWAIIRYQSDFDANHVPSMAK